MTMDYKRLFLYAAFAIVAMSLWTKWQQEHPAKPAQTSVAITQTTQQNDEFVPSSTTVPQAVPATAKTHMTPLVASSGAIIQVKTNTLSVDISSLGGNLITARLLKFPEQLHSKVPYTLLTNDQDAQYVAQSGFTNLTANNQPLMFTSAKSNYSMADNDKQLSVKLTATAPDGMTVDKTYTFTQDSYLVQVAYQITNHSQKAWSGQFYTQLVRAEPASAKASMFHIASYTGASVSDPAGKMYRKISFKEMSKSNLNELIKGGWLAMQEHYFLSAWIPHNSATQHRFYTNANGNNVYTVGMIGTQLNAAPNSSVSSSANLYIGPEENDILKNIAPGLNLTIDYGFLWFIAIAIFWLLQKIYSIIGNWGWSIILVTIIIKLAFYRLSATSYRSMANMRKLQPRMQALKERFGDDKAKLSQATMELYKKEKINPLGGCLPMLIQIPFFIALYWVLLESIELRQAPFILWIHDLSAPDPFYILPVIMGLSMFLQQKMNPAPPDPTQAKVMMFLPVIFTFLFLHFPSGLVLYWIVNTALSVLQQWYIMHKCEVMEDKKKAVKR